MHCLHGGALQSSLPSLADQHHLAPPPHCAQCLEDATAGGAEPQSRSCLGQQAVLRIAFGNFMFFSLHLLLLLGVTLKTNPRLAVHTGFWPFK